MNEQANNKKPPQEANSKSVMQTGRAVSLPVGALAEMVYRPEKAETLFCVMREGETSYEPELTLPTSKVMPLRPSNALVQNEIVLFPSEAVEYGSEERLISEIRNFIHKHVDVSTLFEQIATYYVLFSWIYDDFDELPYLRVRGDAGSGKSRFLETVGSICYKPIFASAASTVSPLFRMIDAIQGTLIVDEGDFRVSDEKAEVVKILNNGISKRFAVLRSESPNGKTFVPRAYKVFGPKLISTRGYFEDRALETRCLTEEMGGRRLRPDISIPIPAHFNEEALQLRNKLLMFRLRHHGMHKVNVALVDRSIEPRLAQVSTPLLSIIEDPIVRKNVQDLFRDYHRELTQDRALDVEAKLLEIIHDLETAQETRTITVRDISMELAIRYGDDFQRKVTPHWVGHMLRRKLGLKTVRLDSNFIIAPTERARLKLLFQKYGIESEEPQESAPPGGLAILPEEITDAISPKKPWTDDIPEPPDPPATTP